MRAALLAAALLPGAAFAHTAWIDASAGLSGVSRAADSRWSPVLAQSLGFEWEAERWSAGADASLSLAPNSAAHFYFGSFGDLVFAEGAFTAGLSLTGSPRSGGFYACQVVFEDRTGDAECGSFSSSLGGAANGSLAIELGSPERSLLADLSLGLNVLDIKQTVLIEPAFVVGRGGSFEGRLVQGRAQLRAALALAAFTLEARGELNSYDRLPSIVGQIDSRELFNAVREGGTQLGARLSVGGLSRGIASAPLLFSAGAGAGWKGEALRAQVGFDWLQYAGDAGVAQVLSLRGGWRISEAWDVGASATVQRDALVGALPIFSLYGGLSVAWTFAAQR